MSACPTAAAPANPLKERQPGGGSGSGTEIHIRRRQSRASARRLSGVGGSRP